MGHGQAVMTVADLVGGELEAKLASDAVVVDGTFSTEFAVGPPAATNIAGPGIETFTITFNPAGLGTRTGLVSIVNNDSDEDPYTFDVTGEGVAPEIGLIGNSQQVSQAIQQYQEKLGMNYLIAIRPRAPGISGEWIESSMQRLAEITGNLL